MVFLLSCQVNKLTVYTDQTALLEQSGQFTLMIQYMLKV